MLFLVKSATYSEMDDFIKCHWMTNVIFSPASLEAKLKQSHIIDAKCAQHWENVDYKVFCSLICNRNW